MGHVGGDKYLSCVFVSVLEDIVLIPVHTTPWDSEKELDELYEVVLVVKDKWKSDVSHDGPVRSQSSPFRMLNLPLPIEKVLHMNANAKYRPLTIYC